MQTKPQITRQRYLSGEVSYEDYYVSLADIAGITFDPEFVSKVRQALEEGDADLNSIPLQQWDDMCLSDRHNVELDAELRRRKDTLSLATGVCMRKAKAKQLSQ